jgi:hypothetical protein
VAEQAALRNPTSNGALWRHEHRARGELEEGRQRDSSRGAPATMASVMPVSTAMNGGIGRPG